jgi:hypothetical protein
MLRPNQSKYSLKFEAMKKISFLLAILFSLSIVLTYGQTEKGKLFLQGSSNLGFDFGKDKTKSDGNTTDNYKYSDFWFKPMAGMTVIDNMPVGLFVDVDSWKTKYTDTDNISRGTEFIVGPFIRYYPVDLKGFKPVAELGMGIGSETTKYTYNDNESKDKAFIFDFWAGIGGTFFVTDFLGIDALIGFERESYSYKVSENEDIRSTEEKYSDICTTFFANFGIVIMVGKGY